MIVPLTVSEGSGDSVAVVDGVEETDGEDEVLRRAVAERVRVGDIVKVEVREEIGQVVGERLLELEGEEV